MADRARGGLAWDEPRGKRCTSHQGTTLSFAAARRTIPALEADVQQVLLEREHELERLHETVAQALRGSGGTLLVEGAPGLGKTRLLDATSEFAVTRGAAVLRARASELERDFPFGVVRQLFEPILRGRREAERAELLAGAAALAERALGVAGNETVNGASGDSGFGVLHGLYWLLANLTEAAPYVLLLDDAHWADESSLRFFAFASPRLADLPVAVVMAVRPAEGGISGEPVRRIAAAPEVETLRPEPLSAEAVARLLSVAFDASPAPEFAEACRNTVGGNPLLLGELARELRLEGVEPTAGAAGRVEAIGPRAVSRTVLVRLSQLGGPASRLAQAVAVLGDGASLRHALVLTGLDHEAAVEAADELGRAGILTRERELAFTHPVIRRAVYDDIAPHARADQHARAGRILSEEGSPAHRVAAHLLATDGRHDAEVVATLRTAAAQALGARRARSRDRPPPARAGRATLARCPPRGPDGAGGG